MATIRIRRTTGSTVPSGLTFGELAFVQGITSFYVTNSNGTSIRVGAEVDSATTLGGASSSDNKIPTQLAVKTYVDGAVSASGVNQFATIAVGGQASIVADQAGDTLTFIAGSGITLTTNAGTDALTVGNSGVLSVTGTSNQISTDVTTGAVTLSLPSALTVPGSLNVTTDLTVTGNLTVNGTTTTVNSDVMTIDDPLIILGTSGGLPLSVADGGKDRGVAFNYFSGTGKTGFFGYDASAALFTFVPDASVVGDIATSGNPGDAKFKDVYHSNGTNSGKITLAGTYTGDRTYTLPDHTGTFVVPSDLGTLGYILKSNGSTSQPTWIAQSGLTSGAATKLETARNFSLSGNVTSGTVSFNGTGDVTLSTTIASGAVTNSMLQYSGVTLGSTLLTLGTTVTSLTGLVGVTATTFYGTLVGNADSATKATNVVTTEQSTGTYYLALASGASSSGVGLSVDATATTPLSYDVALGVLTCVKLEAIVDGGTY